MSTTSVSSFSDVLEAVRTLAGGSIFAVTFTKKDGSERKMLCRLDVHKNLKGVGLAYDPTARGYLIVWDMIAKGYRTVNFQTLTRLKVRGQEFVLGNDGVWSLISK
jgi:hypothetical protein